MLNGSHRDVYRIYDLTVVHLFKCIITLGPPAVNMPQAPRSLNPARSIKTDKATEPNIVI